MSVSPIHSVTQAQEEANQSAEALLISALLESGSFTPEAHRIDVEMLSCWEHLWRFAAEYQQVQGQAPPIELVTLKWPDFEPVYGVGLDWAVGKMREAHYQRETRRNLQGALTALRENDTDKLIETIKQVQSPPSFMPAKGTRASDPSNVLAAATKTGFAYPYTKLQQTTMGLGRGELTYLAGRYGHGKSYDLCWLAAWWAEAGLRVRYVSMEMPKVAVNRRVNRIHARTDDQLRKSLANPDANVRVAALQAMHSRIKGWVEVIDPSDMPLTTTTIGAAAQDVDIVMVDHAGILANAKGRMPVEDWRVQAEVSNVLKRIALAEDVAVLAAAQLNREGDTPGQKMAQSKNLGGSDALGQDADGVILVKLLGTRTQKWKADKVREGVPVTWYTRYDPTNGDFSEIDKDTALQRQIEDDAAAADD